VKIVKTTLVGLATVASLAFATACSNGGGAGSTASPSASPSPVKSLTASEQFTEAATLLRGTPYKFVMKADDGSTYDGSADPLAGVTTGKFVVVARGAKVTVDEQLTQSDYFLKISGLPLPGVDGSKWFHVDPTKLKTFQWVSFGGPADPTGLQDLVKALNTAESAGDKKIKGTFDFTKATWGPVVNAATVKGLADKAKSVPFEATVDDKGRLATLKVTVPAVGSGKEIVVDVTYSDFGTSVKASPPPSTDTIEAPAALYTVLNAGA
jgi:hypothetical protein